MGLQCGSHPTERTVADCCEHPMQPHLDEHGVRMMGRIHACTDPELTMHKRCASRSLISGANVRSAGHRRILFQHVLEHRVLIPSDELTRSIPAGQALDLCGGEDVDVCRLPCPAGSRGHLHLRIHVEKHHGADRMGRLPQ